jgi:hypothetical protein
MVAIDGSKIRANTSRHEAMSYGRMKKEEARLEREITTILDKMDEVNAEEDAEYGDDDDGGGGLPEALQDHETRREKIRALREELERERGKDLTDKSQKSFADPEARMMKTGDGSLQYAYNVQMAASEDGILVATGLTQRVRDTGQLLPMVEAVKRTTGRRPGWVLADNGYLSEDGLKALRKKRQRCLVAAASRNEEADALAQGAGDPAHASDAAAAVGEATLREAQDPGRASLRGDQSRDGIPSLWSARGLQATRRMGSGVCGFQPKTAERPAGGHGMSEVLSRPLGTGFKTSSRGKPEAGPTTQPFARANLGSDS